jgi:hypothetical protein
VNTSSPIALAAPVPETKAPPVPSGVLAAEPTARQRRQGQLYGGTVVAEPDSQDATRWHVRVTSGDGRYAQVQATLRGQFGAEQLKPGSYVKRELDVQLRTWPLLAAHEGGTLYVEAPRAGQSTRAYWFAPGVPLTPKGLRDAVLVFEAAPGQVVRDRTFQHGRGADNLHQAVSRWRAQHGQTAVVDGQRYRVGEPADVRAYGNARQLFQVLDAQGRFNLYLQSTRSGETRLIWTQAERPIDVEHLAGAVDSQPSAQRQAEQQARPWHERVLDGPLKTPLTDKIERWNVAMKAGDKAFARSERDRAAAAVPPQSVLEQAGAFVGGVVLGAGKAIFSPLVFAPHLPSGNGLTGLPITPESAQGQAATLSAANKTSDNIAWQQARAAQALARAGGIDSRSRAYRAGEITGEVAVVVAPMIKPIGKWVPRSNPPARLPASTPPLRETAQRLAPEPAVQTRAPTAWPMPQRFKPPAGVAAPHQARLGSLLNEVNSVASLLKTPTGTSAGNFRLDRLTPDELAALDTALRTPEGKLRLLDASDTAPLQTQFLRQTLAEQTNPALVDVRTRRLSAEALVEQLPPGQTGTKTYRYVQLERGGPIHREAVYELIDHPPPLQLELGS